MKTFSIIGFVLLLSVSGLFGQDNIIDKQFAQYKGQDNFTTVSITGKLFELAGYIDLDEGDEELQEIKDFITTIESFQLIAGRNIDGALPKYKDARSIIDKSYEELLRVEDQKGDFSFYIDETRGVVKELVMAGTHDNQLFIGSLTGRMDLKELSKLMAKVQSGDFAHMSKLHEHGVVDVKVYPNPAPKNEALTIEVPEHLVGGNATIYDMQGRVMKNERISDKSFSVTTRRLDAGSYTVHLVHEGVTIKKQFVIQ